MYVEITRISKFLSLLLILKIVVINRRQACENKQQTNVTTWSDSDTIIIHGTG